MTSAVAESDTRSMKRVRPGEAAVASAVRMAWSNPKAFFSTTSRARPTKTAKPKRH